MLHDVLEVQGRVFPAVVGKALATVRLSVQPWWDHLAPTVAGDNAYEAGLHYCRELLTPQSAICSRLFAERGRKQISKLGELLAVQSKTALLRDATRQQVLMRQIAGIDQEIEASGRGADGVWKNVVKQSVANLNEGIGQACTAAAGSHGELLGACDERIAKMSEHDLTVTPGGKSAQLALSDEFKQDLESALVTRAKEFLRLQSGVVEKQLGKILQDASRVLAEDLESMRGTQTPFSIDHREVWRQVKRQVEISVRYRGEMPQRGFLQRLGEGRRKVFAILMFSSLFGGAAALRSHPLITLFTVVLFLGGFLWTYIHWRKEDDEKMTRELARAREACESEARRLANSIGRELNVKLNAEVNRIVTAWLAQAESGLSRASQQRLEQLKTNRDTFSGRLKQLSGRLRELEPLEAECRAICTRIEEALNTP